MWWILEMEAPNFSTLSATMKIVTMKTKKKIFLPLQFPAKSPEIDTLGS